MHILLIGILLGLGVAAPLGPINVEIIRRNIIFGVPYGVVVGVGATCADTTYIVLILGGIIAFLKHPIILNIVGIAGALVLLWFAYKNLTCHPKEEHHALKRRNLWHTWIAGYLMTLLSPLSVIFWSSISTQIASFTHGEHNALFLATLGVIIGTLTWSLSLNTILYFTRHKFSLRSMRILNIIGGLVLLAFAIAGIWHSLYNIL